MRSDMFPASSFAKWETVMIAEEMEGEGVAKSDAALNNEAQVEPLEKKGKFEASLAAVSSRPRTSAGRPAASPPLPLHFLSASSASLLLNAFGSCSTSLWQHVQRRHENMSVYGRYEASYDDTLQSFRSAAAMRATTSSLLHQLEPANRLTARPRWLLHNC